MDQTEEVTAEFKTEDIQKEAEVLPTSEHVAKTHDIKSWIPVAVGLVTLAIMVVIAFRFWLAP